MRLDHLTSLVAISDHGSFSAAAHAINLSHSAVSIQIRQLEENIGADLFDRATRPPKLTPLGRDYVEHARGILVKVKSLNSLGLKDNLTGTVAFGFVPTTLQTLLPMTLKLLQDRYKGLHVTAISGLSDDLTAGVEAGTLDFAFLTAPSLYTKNIQIDQIAKEQLYVIAPLTSAKSVTAQALLKGSPYIAFSRKTLLGRQILKHLSDENIQVDKIVELDSIDAVENMVAQGFGVSIVPQRIIAPKLSDRLHCIPFGGTRDLVLASHKQSNRQTLRKVVIEHLLSLSGVKDWQK